MSWSTPRNMSTRPVARTAWHALCWSVGNDSTSSPAIATFVARERDDASYSVIKMVSQGHRERRRGEERVGADMWAIATVVIHISSHGGKITIKNHLSGHLTGF